MDIRYLKVLSQNHKVYIEVSYFRYRITECNLEKTTMDCETSCCGSEGRRFLTTEEKMEKLGTYKKWLQDEAKGVEEAIARIKKAK